MMDGTKFDNFFQKYFPWCVAGCVIMYVYVLAVVPTDFSGDTTNYVDAALRFCQWRGGVVSSFLRMPAYPIFICISSLKFAAIPFIYAVQAALFIASLVWMCRIVGSLACIALLIAAIPYYAYLQKLLYPDGLLASGSLLFLACLCTKRYYGAAIVAVLLTLVKLIFIFTFAVIIFAWVYEKRNFNIKILAAASALCIFAAVFLFFSQIFYYRDWAFMVTFVRPTLAGIAPSEIIPPGGLRVTCGQSEHFVSSDRLNFVPILESQRTSPLGLLSEEDAVALRCTPAEIETLKLQSVLTALAYRPFLHAGLAVKYLINALVGRFLNGHAAYMVDWRGGLWVQNVNLLSLYPQSEIDQLDKYAREGFAFNLRRPNVIYYVSGIFEQWLEGLIRISVVVLLIAGLVILYRRNEINRFMIDRVSVSMMAFLLSYSACLAASAHSLSDRYTFPNFLVLSLLSARISMLALRGFDKQQ